jgi:tetratricopeptide (TPR) repeat protein
VKSKFFFSLAPFLALTLNFASPSQALTPMVIKKNNEAVELLEKEKNPDAYRTLTEALSDSPFQPELHLNLAFGFEKGGELEKALSEYNWVFENSEDPSLKFEAVFNAARIKGQAKKIDEALSLYQKALELKPDSLEVKTNIELLLKEGGGGGKGDQEKKDDKGKGNPKDEPQKEGNDQKPQPKPQTGPTPKPKPKPFKSEDISERDVKNILDELKRQENQIRAKEHERKPKENTNGKDW